MTSFFIPNLIHYFMILYNGLPYMPTNQKFKPPIGSCKLELILIIGPLSRLSRDIKVMPRSSKGHKFILCVIDEVTNYLITMPLYQARSEEVREALIENVITKYCIPDCIIMDQDSTFMSSLMNFLFTKFNIKNQNSCSL